MNKQFRLIALCSSLVLLPACFDKKEEVKPATETTETVVVTEEATPATPAAKEVMEMQAAEATTAEATTEEGK